MSVIQICVLVIYIPAILSTELPCRKLSFFGNNIQSKAVLSPVIIVGQSGKRIPFGSESYKAGIEIKSIIKGSLEDWTKNILLAGMFSTSNNATDLCRFMSTEGEIEIYFLKVVLAQNGEFDVLFQSETWNQENLEVINKTICSGCAESPKLFITKQSSAEQSIQLDCVSESKPSPIVKWMNQDSRNNVQIIQLRNGARLIITSGNTATDEIYTCMAANVLGESTANVIIRDGITRCSINDQLLCNGHGKCYKDITDDGKMFCRCQTGFTGSRCSNNPNKPNYLKRSPASDNNLCNRNGEGYVNVKTNKQYCICNSGFYGETCSIRNKEENVEIKMMIDAATSRLAMRYIIVGSAIVLAGCILVIIIVVITCQCYIKRSRRKTQKDYQENEKLHGTNDSLNGDLSATKYLDNTQLLPEAVATSLESPRTFNSSVRVNYNEPYSGKDIYDNVPRHM